MTYPDPPPAELAAFLAALRQHENGGSYAWREDYASSGHFGAYQIGRPEWAAWSALAGVNPADHSPAAQDRVAAGQAARYYRQFGTWRGVAIAWYGGPNRAAQDAARPGSVDNLGNPPMKVYVADIMAGMAGRGASAPQPITFPSVPGVPDPGDAVDAAAALARLVNMATSWDTLRRLLLVAAGAGMIALGFVLLGGDTPLATITATLGK